MLLPTGSNRALDANRVGIPPKYKGHHEVLARLMNDAEPKEGVSKETISKWTKGETVPRRGRRFALLARVLGVDLVWLQMGGGGDGPIFSDVYS